MEILQAWSRRLRSAWRDIRYVCGALYWRLRGYEEDGGMGVRVPARPKPPVRPASAARPMPKP